VLCISSSLADDSTDSAVESETLVHVDVIMPQLAADPCQPGPATASRFALGSAPPLGLDAASLILWHQHQLALLQQSSEHSSDSHHRTEQQTRELISDVQHVGGSLSDKDSTQSLSAWSSVRASGQSNGPSDSGTPRIIDDALVRAEFACSYVGVL
jgi:hypothetical protein